MEKNCGCSALFSEVAHVLIKSGINPVEVVDKAKAELEKKKTGSDDTIELLDGGLPLSKDDQARSDKLMAEHIDAKKRGREFDEQLKTGNSKRKEAGEFSMCVHNGCSRGRVKCETCKEKFIGLFCEEHTGAGQANCMSCETVLYDCSKCGEACEEDFITTFEKVKPYEAMLDGVALPAVNKLEVSFRLCDDCISS